MKVNSYKYDNFETLAISLGNGLNADRYLLVQIHWHLSLRVSRLHKQRTNSEVEISYMDTIPVNLEL